MLAPRLSDLNQLPHRQKGIFSNKTSLFPQFPISLLFVFLICHFKAVDSGMSCQYFILEWNLLTEQYHTMVTNLEVFQKYEKARNSQYLAKSAKNYCIHCWMNTITLVSSFLLMGLLYCCTC